MSIDLDLLTSSYDYELPKSQIATSPAKPADSARLLVYDRVSDTITDTVFSQIADILPKETLLFFNDTKVIKARIFGYKSSGGKVELLFNKQLADNSSLVMIRGRVKEGSRLLFDEGLEAEVIALNSDGSRVVKFYQSGKELNFEELVDILDKIGHIPLPPYINRDDKVEDETDYQTLFAGKAGAVAAPTASLHFTHSLLERLKSEHKNYTLTLHVGAGTFKPVESENILKHPMHSEYFHIPQDAAKAIDEGGDILAVGTTVTRTIEYYARVGKLEGECDLFLHPKNPPIKVKRLLTNFHLPKSTLIMLVSAFIGRQKTLQLYKYAIDKGYRFYSYGDAMLIL